MICPHDNAECFSVRCDANKSCIYPVNSPPKPTMEEIEMLAGDVSMAMSALLAAAGKMGRGAPKDGPPVSLDEIERLVDAFESAIDHVHYFGGVEHTNNLEAARAALMAAIRSLSNSTQDGE